MGKPAPLSCRVFDIASKSEVELSQLVQDARKPLILNFGSSS